MKSPQKKQKKQNKKSKKRGLKGVHPEKSQNIFKPEMLQEIVQQLRPKIFQKSIKYQKNQKRETTLIPGP